SGGAEGAGGPDARRSAGADVRAGVGSALVGTGLAGSALERRGDDGHGTAPSPRAARGPAAGGRAAGSAARRRGATILRGAASVRASRDGLLPAAHVHAGAARSARSGAASRSRQGRG